MEFREIRLDAARTVTIADDGALPGGTKQRLMMRLVPTFPVGSTIIYAGAAQGAAQPALAYAISQHPERRLRAVVFISETRPRSAMTARAAALGAEIREIRGNLKAVIDAAERFAAKPKCILLPFGLHTDEYIRILREELATAWAGRAPPKRLWMVAGSMTMYRAYHDLFGDTTESNSRGSSPASKDAGLLGNTFGVSSAPDPDSDKNINAQSSGTEFHLVQVGKTIWPDQLRTNTTLHVSPQPFWEIADPQPPYPTVATYDAKLWYFSGEFRDGDVIVNVAADELKNGGTELVVPDAAAAAMYQTLRPPWRPATRPPFPYKVYAMTPESITRRFLALRDYELRVQPGTAPIYNITNAKPAELLYAGAASYAQVLPGDYWDYDLISDAFTEEVRMDCRRFDADSPHTYWIKNWRQVIATSRGTPLVTAIRDRLATLCPECTTFKPSLLVGFAKLLCGPKPRILDISSGWGDRLIGAMALDAASYYAADPNTSLQPGYDAIRAAFGHLATGKYETIPVPFEELDLSGREFDLVFTSPPYWNLELYGSAAAQSTSRHNGLEAWFNEFLMASLRRAAATLVVGGHLVININDAQQSASYRQEYTMRMVRELQDTLQYVGCLPQWVGPPSKKSAQPFWIYVKL